MQIENKCMKKVSGGLYMDYRILGGGGGGGGS